MYNKSCSGNINSVVPTTFYVPCVSAERRKLVELRAGLEKERNAIEKAKEENEAARDSLEEEWERCMV
jgi:hypothetical protein